MELELTNTREIIERVERRYKLKSFLIILYIILGIGVTYLAVTDRMGLGVYIAYIAGIVLALMLLRGWQ